MDGWNTRFFLGWPIFRYYVRFGECIPQEKNGPRLDVPFHDIKFQRMDLCQKSFQSIAFFRLHLGEFSVVGRLQIKSGWWLNHPSEKYARQT